ncbi:MAG: HD domain-containing phosphohydrolase [Candidatus Thiodiazotropha sp.]
MDTKPTLTRPHILVVDDEPFFLDLLVETLKTDYEVSVAKNGKQALRRAQGSHTPNLILLDVLMPEMDGYAACERLKENPLTHEIPVIFLTAKSDVTDELKGFELGAVDYITKPISIPILLTRVRTQLALSEQRIALDHLVAERTEQLERTKNAVVYSMGSLAEARDEETGGHILRTREYVKALGKALSENIHYRERLNDRNINIIARAAQLHDIGKVGVPDRVLQKKGALNAEERREMDQHVIYGRDAIINAERHVGATSFTAAAKEIAYCHHEKWDGSGYPQGLSGEEIPLSARMMALADVYDALVSRRYYKPPIPHAEAKTMIIKASGTHFDPALADAFDACSEIFHDISERYSDAPAGSETEPPARATEQHGD